MRRDGHDIADGAALHADVCIVGAGPAGLALAQELNDQTSNVICLESGGLGDESSAQALNEGAVIGAPYAGLQQTRHRQLGGTANTWNTPLNGVMGAKYVPLDACDFGSQPDTERRGWPIDMCDLNRFYQRAQDTCGLGPFRYDGDYWCEQNSAFPLPDKRVSHAIYQFASAQNLVDRQIRTLSASDSIQLLYHATACALKLDASRRYVRCVEVATLAGNRFKVQARIFVLAGGAVENARLLLHSREPGREAPGNEHDWVGRCFMEHPRDRAMVLLPHRPDVFRQAAFYDRHIAHANTVICGRIALDPQTITDERLLNASVTLLPLAHEAASKHGLLARAAERLARRFRNAPPAGHGWSTLEQPERVYRGFQLLVNTEHLPHPDNRVTLGSEADSLGMPKPVLHLRWREHDQAHLKRLRGVLSEAIGAAQVGQIHVDDDRLPDLNAHHHAGTTRMQSDARWGVVNGDCRVHGNDNLYIAGASVFPSVGFANPTLTIVALALRLAEHLKQRL